MNLLDASALLAYAQDEPGAAHVEEALGDATFMSIVNYAEVLARLSEDGVDARQMDGRWRGQGLVGQLIQLVPVTENDAIVSAELRIQTRPYGLSLGDRVCLATALRLGAHVLTADRVWGQLPIPVDIRVIR